MNVNKLKWKGGRLKREKIYVYLCLIGASLVAQLVKNLPAMQRFNPWVRRSSGGRHGNPLQYSCLENLHGQRSWWATVHGVAKSRTCLSD